jgi:chromosome segregation ATPase
LKEKDRNFASVKGELGFLKISEGKWENEMFLLKKEKFDLEGRVEAATQNFNEERALVRKLGAEGISREILIKELECRAQDLTLEKSVLGKKLAIANNLSKSVLSVDDISLKDELKVLETEVDRLKSQKLALQGENFTLMKKIEAKTLTEIFLEEKMNSLEVENMNLGRRVEFLQLRVDENQSQCGLDDVVSEKVDNWIRENSKFFIGRTGSESVESNIFNAPSGGEYSMRADLNENLEGKMFGGTERISGKARQKIMDLIGDIQVLNGMYREQAKVLRYLKEDNAG